MSEDGSSAVGTAAEHELDLVFELDARSFSHRDPESVVAEWRKSTDLSRTVVSRTDGEVVGSAISLPTVMTLPGLGRLPTAAVVGVAVQPTHRRRGRLTEMMRYQLDDIRSRNEPLATLYSSEGTIYGRYGYGPATFGARYRLDRSLSRFRVPVSEVAPGSVRMVDATDAREAFPPLLDVYVRTRAGEVDALPGEWMDIDGIGSPEEARQRFFALYEENGRIDGALSYHVAPIEKTEPWPPRAVFVERMVTVSDAARAALWNFVLGIDLVKEVRTTSLPLDEPLRWWLSDHRQFRATLMGERTWVRLVDVEQCLRTRRYEDSGTIVIGLEDEFCPWNTAAYRITAKSDPASPHVPTPELPASVERVEDVAAADISLDAAALASVYLGGVSLMSLARAGRVHARSEAALVIAARMFRSLQSPFCTTHF